MKIKCEYCNNYLDDTEEKCPNCGAVNNNYKRVGEGVPTTIEELQQWYKERNLPPQEVTRFFIGIDYKEPKAFGIYKDSNTGNFVVYKNKDTGERAIRYEGNDEKYAVNELYLKLKEEILNQKSVNINNSVVRKKNSVFDIIGKIVTILFFAFFIAFIAFVIVVDYITPDRGYYNINNQEYYYVQGDWYVFLNDHWKRGSTPDYDGNLNDYYDGYYPSSDADYDDITNSSVYDDSWDSSSSGGSWDSDSDWSSSDSWDSGSTDWSSDW